MAGLQPVFVAQPHGNALRVAPSSRCGAASPYKRGQARWTRALAAAAVGATVFGTSRRALHRSRKALWKVACSAQGTEMEVKKDKKLTDRQEQFWEMLEEDFAQDVILEFGEQKVQRVLDFIKYCKYELEIPELPALQEINPEYFPGLRAQPWWDPAEAGEEWIQKVEDGLYRVQGELADLLEDDEGMLIQDSVKNDVMGGGWSGFRLQRLGCWISRNVEVFPQTVQLLSDCEVPLAMRGVIIARQTPGSGVNPHSDGRNMFLTAHFGLSIPPECDMTVGGETREWIEDKAVILDTSFIHSTRNDSDEDRFVLIVDFWHPDLTYEEREALEYIYDYRNKWEQGKIKYLPKMPEGFLETLHFYSGWGGAYTEETVGSGLVEAAIMEAEAGQL
mmetsp:Transcript_52211/g.122156  ORF Transcript_52211/g.122156 Transcript_52211/m.122156 type:complete len:391 (-) Transcript_52211:30-1202(-)